MKPLLVLLFSFLSVLPAPSQEPAAPGLLVSTQWLSEHLQDPGLVVVHVAGVRRDYLTGQVPGARFLWPGYVAMSNPDLTYQVLPVTHLDSIMEGLGISNDSRIILCGVNGNASPTARVFLTMEYLGLGGRISILDGGFDAWKREGREISTATPVVPKGNLIPAVKASVFATAEEVMSAVEKQEISIVDARAPGFYAGTTPNGMPRAGHVPGARNVFYSTLVDSMSKMQEIGKIQKIFADAGVGASQRVIAYCHVGQTASLVYFAARLLGHEASLFDGSFEEWSGREELPVELPPAKDGPR
jgi:thiosulfate/3-mercaptopyruvate sulfurtransferase